MTDDPMIIPAMVEKIRRVEAIVNRALTPDEVITLKAGAFFRRIAPQLFEDEPDKTVTR